MPIYEEENKEKDSFDQATDALKGNVEQEEQIQEQAIEEEKAIQNEAEELTDPRGEGSWGFKAVAKELQSALTGGVQDTATSVATFAERTADALSGEMQEERKEKGYYEPEWDPFKSYSNPIVTKTWWGKMLRGTVHFGTMAGATVLAAKGAVAAGAPLGLSLIHI